MSETRIVNVRVGLMAAALALAAGIVVGRLAATPAPARASVEGPGSSQEPRGLALPGAGVKRYHVPVTMSQPTKGSADAIVTIVEWCNFQNSECRRIEPILEKILERYGADARLVFRHFAGPSTMPHEFARIAHEQASKFWEAKDLLMRAQDEPTRADLEGFAKQIGLDRTATNSALDRRTHAGHIAADKLFAKMFDVREVPALFVNGRPLAGEVTLGALESLIDDERARAQKLVSSGVRRDSIYAELTKNGDWNRPVGKSR